ncbi:hypothetical protein D3C71_1799980 [compost metagenome]
MDLSKPALHLLGGGSGGCRQLLLNRGLEGIGRQVVGQDTGQDQGNTDQQEQERTYFDS